MALLLHAESGGGMGGVSQPVLPLPPGGIWAIGHRLSSLAVPPRYEGTLGAARQLGWGRVTNAEALRVLVRRLVAVEDLSAEIIVDLRREGAR